MARRPVAGHDPSRREFFRAFSRETIHNAGAVAGAAAELRRTSLAAARELLELPPDVDARRPVADPGPAVAGVAESFRSPYRVSGDALIVLDQRELPHRVLTFECADEHSVATALRSGAVTPGPVLGEVAAYGMVLAARRARERPPVGREQRLRAAAGALRAARREVRVLTTAVDRMEGRYDAAAAEPDADIEAALTAEADAIAVQAMAAHASIGRHLAAWLRALAGAETRIDVLVHGDLGPLSFGMVGPLLGALQALVSDGSEVHVWLTDAQPSGEGTRIAAHGLSQADVAHTVVPDTAVGWLLANRPLTAALLRGDTVAVNADVVALIGARSMAVLAHAASVPLGVVAPRAALAPDVADGHAVTLEMRSAAESGAARRARLNPGYDIVPGALISAVIDELDAGA